MNKKFRNFLISVGMPADLSDDDAAKWAAENNYEVVDTTEDTGEDQAQAIKNLSSSVSNLTTAQTAIQQNIAGRLDKIEGDVSVLAISSDGKNAADPKRGFDSHIDFFNEVIKSGMNGHNVERMPENLRPLFNTVGSDESRQGSNPDGGFLIPPAFLAELLKGDPQALQVDSGAFTRKIPMASDLVYLNARVDKNHSESVSGGFRVYRRAEAETVESSKAQFEQIELKANGLMGISYATEEILSRSPISFAALIQDGFKDEKISKLNYERLWGSGVGEFLGIMNSDALISVAKESGQSADTIVGKNIVKMRARAWRYGQCVWMANQDTYEQLFAAHVPTTNGNDIRVFKPAETEGQRDMILGRPVLYDENMATVGDKGDLALVNWNEYLEGMLGGSSFAESIHVRFVYNERAFRFTVYNDGCPWWRSALTPKKSSQTLSPFITLNARG
jgi:HK97 family phage major capsid protein